MGMENFFKKIITRVAFLTAGLLYLQNIVTLHLTILKPTISIRSDNSLFCETHEMALRVESDYEQFEWNTGDLGESIVATEPGTYSVTGSNKFCSGTAQYTIPHCDFSVICP